jgi:hypothetical protein
MAVPARANEKSVTTGDSGDFRAMHLHKPCGYAACQEPGLASVGNEDLCCDHFVLRCYEFLQQIDAEPSRNDKDCLPSRDLKSAINSCLQGALDVSLRSASLNNLQKARLLDIMLWAGEYIHRSGSSRFSDRNLSEAHFVTQSSSQRSSYQKPQIKSRTTLPPESTDSV